MLEGIFETDCDDIRYFASIPGRQTRRVYDISKPAHKLHSVALSGTVINNCKMKVQASSFGVQHFLVRFLNLRHTNANDDYFIFFCEACNIIITQS